jgi:predicted nucleic acid-binding protein
VCRPCGRELDLAIAASAIRQDAAFWTLNPRDFADIPRLRLVEPTRR